MLIAPAGIASEAGVSQPALVQIVRPASWQSSQVGAPALQPGPVVIAPQQVPSAEGVGAQRVILLVRPGPAREGETVGQLVVLIAGRIAPQGIAPPSVQAPPPTVSHRYVVSGSGAIPSTAAVGGPSLRQVVRPPGVAPGETGAPRVGGGGILSPEGFGGEQVPAPVLRRPEDRYRRYALNLAPTWLLQDRGANWLDTHGAAVDALVERVVDAVQAHLVDTAPDDALGLLGRERNIARFPGEPDWSYRGQVRSAWDLWQWGGTRRGLIQLFQRLGYQQVAIGELWMTDRSRWAEFVIYLFGPTKLSLTRDQVVRLVNEWKAAHSKLAGIIQIIGGFRWDDGTLWDDYPQDPDAWWDGDIVIA